MQKLCSKNCFCNLSEVNGVLYDLKSCTDLLQILVVAKSSLYRCVQSSLKRDFTRLTWDDRWILGRRSDRQVTAEFRTKSFTACVSRTETAWTQKLTSRTCGFAHRCTPTLEGTSGKTAVVFFAINTNVNSTQSMLPNKHTYCR